MRATTLISILLLSILVGAVSYVIIYLYNPHLQSPGQGRGSGIGPQVYVLIPIISVPVTFSVGLLAYMILFPEIEQKPSPVTTLPAEQQSLVAIMKVLKEDEKKVVQLLIDSGGSMLQRDISRKAGFTRVKTHRILYRLSVRGVVTAEKHYNTYQITLADWLRK